MSGAQRKFLQQGIVSLEILQSRELATHYVEGLFEAHHLLKILVSKLVVTEVSKNEFMMPSVMEVSDIYPSPRISEDTIRSSFVLHFSDKSWPEASDKGWRCFPSSQKQCHTSAGYRWRDNFSRSSLVLP